MLKKLYKEEAVSGHPLNRLDEKSSQVQPVAGFLVLACSYEGLELAEVFARREASFTCKKSVCKRLYKHGLLCWRGVLFVAAKGRAGVPFATRGHRF